MQSLPVTGLIMVTTPQKLAALIVNKAVHMAQQIGVSIVGVIENMAYYRCPETGKKHYIFGQSNGGSVTHLANAPLLAQIPIDPAIAEECDAGNIENVVIEEVSEMVSKLIKSIASIKQVKILKIPRQFNQKKTVPRKKRSPQSHLLRIPIKMRKPNRSTNYQKQSAD